MALTLCVGTPEYHSSSTRRQSVGTKDGVNNYILYALNNNTAIFIRLSSLKLFAKL